MVYVRGNRHDYDRWAQMGLAGWSHDEVLPAFRCSEGHVHRDGPYPGRTGELTVCRARETNPQFDAFIEAGRQTGYPVASPPGRPLGALADSLRPHRIFATFCNSTIGLRRIR